MSVSFWLDHSGKAEVERHDAVIIGAGIAGLSTAYWMLKKDPSLRIAIVEKARIASGASGRNAGFITCGSVEHFSRLVENHGRERALEIWQFSEENLRLLLSEITPGVEAQIGFEQKGSFSLASTEAELEELKKTAEIMRSAEIPVEELNSDAVQTRLGARNFAGGIKYLSDASVDPVALCEAIFSKIETHVDLFEQTEVFHVDSDGSRQVVLSDRYRFECDLVVSAMNGYSASLSKYLADKVFATRGQILMFAPVDAFMEGPCYANFVLDYFRQLPGGELLIGGFRQLEKDTEVGYSDHVTSKIQNALHEFVDTYLPQYKNSHVTHRWAGVMGFSADGQPLLGALPDNAQHFFLAGFTGHGLGLAFHSGKKLVDSIFGESLPEFLSARRF